MPWRKGPFKFGPIDLDTEWRSDLKWDRLQAKIDLTRHRVLDVGSGSGYHLWRMLEAGAYECRSECLFLVSLQPSKASRDTERCVPASDTRRFDTGILDFDTVFSMGVLYHRKDPFLHLEQLKRWVKPVDQLVWKRW